MNESPAFARHDIRVIRVIGGRTPGRDETSHPQKKRADP
jgi:hypothetical protein